MERKQLSKLLLALSEAVNKSSIDPCDSLDMKCISQYTRLDPAVEKPVKIYAYSLSFAIDKKAI